MCFAGGMSLPECQSTIAKVKRNLARGRGFPQCSFLSNQDGSIGGQNNSPKIWTEYSKKWVIVKMKDEQGKVSEISGVKRR